MSIPVTLELGNSAEPKSDLEILTFSRLSGLRKVAVLFRSLALQDEAAARLLLGSLNSMEQVRIKEELDSMGVLGSDMVTDVLREFDVLCGIHKAYREGGIDGAISVGEKFLHKAQARRLAATLGSQNGTLQGFEDLSEDDAGEAPVEESEQVKDDASDGFAGEEPEELDLEAPIASEDEESAGEEIAALADLEEKDLEDVAT